jgi:hypothetical protein
MFGTGMEEKAENQEQIKGGKVIPGYLLSYDLGTHPCPMLESVSEHVPSTCSREVEKM